MTRRTSTLSLLAALLAAACSGGGGSSPGSTQVHTTRGAITAKSAGTMTVNGIALSTAGAAIRMDDQPGHDEWLRKGMVVTVRGGFDDRGGDADEIEFEHEVEGPVTEIGEDWIVVGGQRVHVDDSTEFGDDNPNRLASLGLGDVVAVSGVADVADDNGGLRASRVDDSPRGNDGTPSNDDDFDIKGFVSNIVAGTSFELRLSPDATRYWKVTVSGVSLPAGFGPGAYVEVHTLSATTPPGGGDPAGLVGTITASSIELEDRFDESEVEIEVEGIVSSGTSASFVIDGVTVVTDGSTRWELGVPADLVPGVKVEAEGQMDGSGVLHAHKVSFRAGVRITGVIQDAGAGTMTILGVHVQLPSFARVDGGVTIANGSKVEVRGNPAASGGGVVALRVQDATGNATRVFVRAVATAKANANPAQPTFTVLGFAVTTAGASFKGLNDEVLTPQAFFAAVETGRTVIKVRADDASLVNPSAKTWAADELELEGED